MIKNKTQGSSLATQLWFERAKKVLAQLEHMLRILEFVSYASLISHRFHNEYKPENPQVAREMRGFTELYSTYQMEYDYFDYKNQGMLQVFFENFE